MHKMITLLVLAAILFIGVKAVLWAARLNHQAKPSPWTQAIAGPLLALSLLFRPTVDQALFNRRPRAVQLLKDGLPHQRKMAGVRFLRRPTGRPRRFRIR